MGSTRKLVKFRETVEHTRFTPPSPIKATPTSLVSNHKSTSNASIGKTVGDSNQLVSSPTSNSDASFGNCNGNSNTLAINLNGESDTSISNKNCDSYMSISNFHGKGHTSFSKAGDVMMTSSSKKKEYLRERVPYLTKTHLRAKPLQ